MSLRPWTGWAVLVPMQALSGTSLLEVPSRTFIHPGDLAWWFGWWPKTTEELAAITQIWEVNGAMVARVVDDAGYIGECIAPGSLDDDVLLASMDRWIDARWRRHARSVRDDDPTGIARFEAAGTGESQTRTWSRSRWISVVSGRPSPIRASRSSPVRNLAPVCR